MKQKTFDELYESVRQAVLIGRGEVDAPPRTRTLMRGLDRRSKDAADRTRFVLATVFAPHLALFYEISDDVFVANEPASATLFKRESAALAIKEQLGDGTIVVRCRVDARGKLLERSISRRALGRNAIVKRRAK